MKTGTLEKILRNFCLSFGFQAACVWKSCAAASSVELVCCMSLGERAERHELLQLTTSRRFSQLAIERVDIIWMDNIIVSEFPFKCVAGIPIQMTGSVNSYALVLSSFSRIEETDYRRKLLHEIAWELTQILNKNAQSA